MNLHIVAGGDVIYPSGLKARNTMSFNCLQTPSVVTYKILESDDSAKAYEEWCLDGDFDFEEDVHDYDVWDYETDYYKVVGKKTVNRRKEHVDDFRKWLKLCEDYGFTLEYFAT